MSKNSSERSEIYVTVNKIKIHVFTQDGREMVGEFLNLPQLLSYLDHMMRHGLEADAGKGGVSE